MLVRLSLCVSALAAASTALPDSSLATRSGSSPVDLGPRAEVERTHNQPSLVFEALSHTSNVIHRICTRHSGPSAEGALLSPQEDELRLHPVLDQGRTLDRLAISSIAILRIDAQRDVSSANGEGVGVTLDVALELDDKANGPIAAEVFGLCLASTERLTVVQQDDAQWDMTRGAWVIRGLEISVAPRASEAIEEDEVTVEGDRGDGQREIEFVLRKAAQHKLVRLGSLTIARGKTREAGAGEGVDGSIRQRHRVRAALDGPVARRSEQLTNFFVTLAGDSPLCTLETFSIKPEADGAWAIRMQIAR